jgi:RNA polymerase sigma-70 factor, ECF subfamily
MVMTLAVQDKNALFLEIESHRGFLIRYATAKLREKNEAEEVVQEALLAALSGIESFSGTATLRTWLTSILKYKIIDFQRGAYSDRERFVQPPNNADEDGDGTDPQWFDQFFDETGHWTTSFGQGCQPGNALEQKRLFEAFEHCMEKLPKATSRVFFQREVMGEEAVEICKVEGISSSNCWTMLHRARVALRECLERSGFCNAENETEKSIK